ncbi:MAG: methyltransferase domain-containing protein [Aeromicrobium sp.]
MTATTPLRSANPPQGHTEAVHLDPAQSHLVAILERAEDLSSWSDDLELSAHAWAERYHLAPQRANVLRSLPLPAQPDVLEIGARCGGLTRYLGELGGLVDALEPDPGLSAVARARCADQPSVRFFADTIVAVPPIPAYDLVVVIDAVDLMDEQELDMEALADRCAAVLRPGGLVVFAADNANGVRNLAGDSAPPIGRPSGGSPRRLLQADVESSFAAAGLATRSLQAFPDHRHTKVLYDHDALTAIDPHLLTELPAFPSPPYAARRSDFPEKPMWDSAVRAGTAAGHANSFVVLAGTTPPTVDVAATYWTMGRRAAQSAVNRIIRSDDGVVVQRSPAFPAAFPADTALHLRPHTEPFVRGASMTAALAAAPTVKSVSTLLYTWRDLVENACHDSSSIPWDLIPRNVVITDAGDAVPIDQEWELDGGDAVTILTRGCFWLAYDLLDARPRPTWLPSSSVATAARLLADLAGLGLPSDWLDSFIDREARHMAIVWPASTRYSRPRRARKEWHNLTDLSNREPTESSDDPTSEVEPVPGTGESLPEVIEALSVTNADLQERIRSLQAQIRHVELVHRDHAIGLMATAETLRRRHEISERSLAQARAKSTRLQKRVRSMQASRTWRIGSFFTRPMARLRGK